MKEYHIEHDGLHFYVTIKDCKMQVAIFCNANKHVLNKEPLIYSLGNDSLLMIAWLANDYSSCCLD